MKYVVEVGGARKEVRRPHKFVREVLQKMTDADRYYSLQVFTEENGKREVVEDLGEVIEELKKMKKEMKKIKVYSSTLITGVYMMTVETEDENYNRFSFRFYRNETETSYHLERVEENTDFISKILEVNGKYDGHYMWGFDDAENDALIEAKRNPDVKVWVIDKTETGKEGFKKTLVLDLKNAHAFFKELRSRNEGVVDISQTWRNGVVLKIRTVTEEDDFKLYTLQQVGTDLELV